MTRPIWNIGSSTVTRIEEQLGMANMPPDRYFTGFERDVLHRHLDWLMPHHYAPEHDKVISSVHSWLIRTRHHTILVDSCAGNHKDRPWTPRFHQLDTPYLQRLHDAGVRPEDIDIVFCTHLHADHTGWNTMLKDGRWVPTFPNAKYYFSKAEAAYWNAAVNPAMASDPRSAVFVDSVLPVVNAGQAVMIDHTHVFDDEIGIEPSPGHTPGHVSITLGRQGERGIFSGDAIHHALQVYAPHWNHMADEDPAQAAITRRLLLNRCAEEGALLFTGHFGAPHVAAIRSKSECFHPVFVDGH